MIHIKKYRPEICSFTQDLFRSINRINLCMTQDTTRGFPNRGKWIVVEKPNGKWYKVFPGRVMCFDHSTQIHDAMYTGVLNSKQGYSVDFCETVYTDTDSSSDRQPPNLCMEAVIDHVRRTWILAH